jgi:hypothetical protein
LSIFRHLSRSPFSFLTITRTIWSEWARAWWSPLSKLSFWMPLASSFEVQPPFWLFWELSDLSGLYRTVPLACWKNPLSVSLGQTVDIYYWFCIHHIFYIPTCFSFLFFIQSNLQFKWSVSVIFSPATIIQSLIFYYCSIIVLYSYPRIVFQVFGSR